MDSHDEPVLIARTRGRLCALRLADVGETMRVPPAEPLRDTPDYVLGLARIRGEAVPLVDLGALLGAGTGPLSRAVTLHVGARTVAAAVEEVVGVRRLDAGLLESLPPLVDRACSGALGGVGTLDGELLSVLRAARLLPEELWARLSPAEGPAR